MYLGWLAITYLVTFVYRSTMAALAPMCDYPFVGSRLPFCTVHLRDNPVNASKIATIQDGFTIVMDQVGQNHDLASKMVSHEHAVQDLWIRVTASNLSSKVDLLRNLETLIEYTMQTAV